MRTRPLLVAAILGLGIVGCDDPEVQEKVTNALEHGATEAELKCTNVSAFYCSTNVTVKSLTAHRFLDGASIVRWRSISRDATQFNSRGENVGVTFTWGSEEVLTAYIEEGFLEIDADCNSSHSYDSIDLSLETCTGFNLPAFGIDP